MSIYSLTDLRQQAPSQFRDLSDEDLVREYSRSIQRPYEEVASYLGVKPRGTLAEMGRQAVAGAVVDLPRMVGQSLQYTGLAPEYGREMAQAAEARGREYEPDMRGRGLVGQAGVLGARALAPVGATLPLAFVPGGQFAAPAAAATLFGTSSAQETYEKLIKQGISEEDASAAARRVGLVQGPLEGVASAVGLRAVRPLATALGGARTTGQVAGALTDTAVLRPFAKGMGINLAVQPATEVAQDVGTELIERSYGAKPEDIGQIASQSALGGAGLTMLLGPLAFGASVQRGRRAEQLQQALYGDNVDPEIRAAARQQVAQVARAQGVPEADADAWVQRQIREDFAATTSLKEQEDSTLDSAKESPYADIAYALDDPTLSAAMSDTDRTSLFSALTVLQSPEAPVEQKQEALDQSRNIISAYVAAEQSKETDLLGDTGLDTKPALFTAPRVQEVDMTGGLTQVRTNFPDGGLGAYQAPAQMGREMPRQAAPAPVEGVPGVSQTGPGLFRINQEPTQVETFVGPRVPAPAPAATVAAPAPAPAPAAPPVPVAVEGVSPTPGGTPTVTPAVPKGTAGALSTTAKGTAKVEEATKPLANVSDAIKEDNEIDRVLKSVADEADTQSDKLFAGVTGGMKKAPGKPSMPAQVYAAIRNAILNPKGAVMVRKAKSVDKDVALTEKYGDKVKQIAAAARKFAEAYEAYASTNLVRSNIVIKRGETADQKIAGVDEELRTKARQVQAALANLGQAVEGNAKDVEAIVRFVKDRAQKEKRGDIKIQNADILLSRAWTAAKNETFMGEPDLLATSPAAVRQSQESTEKGATPQLFDAVTEGYATFGRGAKQPGLNGLLNYIRTQGTTFEKLLAQAIKKAIEGKREVKVEFIKEGKSRYEPKTNTIFINQNSSKEVVLHEALHGALQWFVYTNPNLPQVAALKASLKRVVEYDTTKLPPKAAEVQAVLKKVMSGKSKTAELDAVLELISYGTTLNDFRRALQGMESNAPRLFVKFANDVMEAIYALVRRMLGVKQSVASDVIENTFQLLESARAAEQDTAAKGKGNILEAAIATTTSAFKKWFGGSKVVNKDGEAKTVYTGTSKDFDFATFKVPKNGVWFTEDAESASRYAVENDSMGFKWEGIKPVPVNTASRVMPVYLRIENPYTMTAADMAKINKQNYKKAQGEFFDTLRRQGYDGVNMGDGIWVVLKEPAQIKSAIGNRGTYSPSSGNILEAAVTSDSAIPSTESDALNAQFQNPLSAEQYKKLSKTLLPKYVSSKSLFDMFGWASVPGKLEGVAEKITEWTQKNSPGATKVASWVNSHFGLQSGVRDALVQAKDDRRGGSMVYEQMAKYFTDLPPQTSIAVLEYMDAKLNSLRTKKPAPAFPNNDAVMKDLADATIEKWWEYAKALRDPRQRDAYAGLEQPGGTWRGGVKFSQGLAFAENVGQLASNSFGVRNISQLISSRTKDEVNDDAITFRTDANGDAILDDQFVGLMRLTPALKQRLDNAKTDAEAAQILAELKPDEFISANKLTTDGRPVLASDGTQLIPDRNYLWDLKEKEKGGFRLTARLDAKQALQVKKGQDLGYALQNTMSLLANSYSANRLTDALAQYEPDTPNAVAFDSLDALNAMLNGEYKGKTFEPNTDATSWTKRVKADQVIKLSADEAKSETVKGLYRNRHQWVQLPNSPTYGALAGKIVNGSVWSAIEDMSDRRPLVNSKVYNGTMRWFKKAKTVYNPATWGTNVASNFTMAMLDDIPLPTIGYATKLYVGYMLPPAMAAKLGISLTREQQQLMLEIMKTNALLGDFSSNELKQSIYDSMRSTIGDKEQGVAERIMQFAKMEKDRIEAIQKLSGKGADALEKADQLAADWYSMQDNVFRVASMLNNLGQQAEAGKKIDAEAYRLAGDHARFAFLDYDIDSKAIRIMRQTAFPFISWPYAAAKLIGHVAVHKPWKLVNLYAGYWILDGLMQALTGDDDDELRTSGPQWARDRLLFGLGPHTHVRVPFLGNSENPVYYDLGKYVVPSSFGDKVPNGFLGLDWWPSFMSPGGPFISAAISLSGGVDPYNGKPLAPPTADNWEKLSARLAYMQSLFAPNLPFANARELTKAVDAFAERTDRSDNFSSLYMARMAGLRFYDFNVQGALDAQERAAKAIERDFKIEIGKLKKSQERLENPDWDTFNERKDELTARMQERIAKVRGMAEEE